MSQKMPLRDSLSTPLFSLTFLGIMLIAANLRAPITALGPVLPDIARTYQLSASTTGLINALPLLIFALISPFVPFLSHRVGIEKTLLGAVFLILVGVSLRSLSGLEGLFLGTLMMGVGIAAANVLVSPLIKRDFPSHSARGIGMYASVMALTAAFASGIAAPLSAFAGTSWRTSIGIWALLAALTLVVWMKVCSKSNQHTMTPSTSASLLSTQVWTSRTAWYVSLFMALHTTVFYTLIDWYPSMALENGVSATAAGFHLLIYQVVAVAANLSTTIIISRLRDQRVLGLACSVFISLGLGGLLYSPALSAFWLALAGIGAGMSMVTCLALFNLRTGDHHQAAQLSGKAQCVGYLIGASGPYIASVLHASSGDWNAVMMCLIALSFLQIFFAWQAGKDRYI